MKRVLIHIAVIGALLAMGAGAVYMFPRDHSTAKAASGGEGGEKGNSAGDEKGKETPPGAVDNPSQISPPGKDNRPGSALTVRGSDGADEDDGGASRYSAGSTFGARGGGESLYSKPAPNAPVASDGGYQLGSGGGYTASTSVGPSNYSLSDGTAAAGAGGGAAGEADSAAGESSQASDDGDADSEHAAPAAQSNANSLRMARDASPAAPAAAAGLSGSYEQGQVGAGQAYARNLNPRTLTPDQQNYGGAGTAPANLPSGAEQRLPYTGGQAAPGRPTGQAYSRGGYAASDISQSSSAPAELDPRQYQQNAGSLDASAAQRSLQQPAAISTPGVGSVAALVGAEGAAEPGAKHLEGPQTPSITIEKTAPIEIQVDEPATFQIAVRNNGDVAAHNVTIVDQEPLGTSFLDASPQPQRSGGILVWQLGTLEPGEEQIITLQLMPEEEGEIGSVAQVTFQAQSSVRTVCTKPQLEVTQSAPPEVLIGDELTVSITISNTGSGAASNVVLESDIPDQFIHGAGNQLEYEVGTLRPGETRQISLNLAANKAGQTVSEILLRADGNRTARHRLPLEVVAPQLQVAMNGPRKRYLERQATYTLSVANTGTAPANNVDLVAQLPKGMKFISTDNQGQYDAQRHAVYWSLEQLPALARGDVQLTMAPVETGEQRILAEARADLGLSVSGEATLQVDGLAALLFTVVDTADPIEIGSETTYEIRVTNTGTNVDTNVHVLAELPPGMSPIGGDGPTQSIIRDQQILFEPLARLAPNSEQIYKVHVKGGAAGVPRIRISVQSDTVVEPVTKEEATRVYSDQ